MAGWVVIELFFAKFILSQFNLHLRLFLAKNRRTENSLAVNFSTLPLFSYFLLIYKLKKLT